MGKWLQLIKEIQYVDGKPCHPGDWVNVGSWVAEKWIAQGLAREGPGPVRFAGVPRRDVVPLEDELLRKLREPPEPPKDLKIAFGMIVFNGDYILEGILQTIYPFAYQICIAEGPVKFWRETLGVTESTDRTVEIIRDFPDPDKKIYLVQGPWKDKLEMCNAWIGAVKPECHYVWEIDSDELYKEEDIRRLTGLLGPDGYDSVALQFRSFYGGFGRHMIGWEMTQPTHRIKRFYPGAKWETHRPPTILAPDGRPWREHKHLSHWELKAAAGIVIYHYSFVWPSQVEMKYRYYENLVAKGGVVEDGFRRIYLAWMRADEKGKAEIERQFKGVHHLVRGGQGKHVCHTVKYAGTHPKWIEEHWAELEARIEEELERWPK